MSLVSFVVAYRNYSSDLKECGEESLHFLFYVHGIHQTIGLKDNSEHARGNSESFTSCQQSSILICRLS